MRPFITVTATALIALSTPALAQPADDGPGRPPSPFRGLDRADREALFDARMAAIPVALRLTPEQRQLWNPVEQSLRAIVTDRLNRQEESRRREAALNDEAESRRASPPAAQGPTAAPQTGQGQAAPPAPGQAAGGQPGQATAPAQAPAPQPAPNQANPPAPQATARPQATERWLEEIEERSQRLAQSAERVRAFSAAMRPFWASLDDRQRRLLGILMRWPRGLGPHGMGAARYGGGDRFRDQERYDGPDRFTRDGFEDDDEGGVDRRFSDERRRGRFSEGRGGYGRRGGYGYDQPHDQFDPDLYDDERPGRY